MKRFPPPMLQGDVYAPRTPSNHFTLSLVTSGLLLGSWLLFKF